MMMMGSNVKIFIQTRSTDLRKNINGLSVLVQEVLKENPMSTNLFVFYNKSKDKIKILQWDKNGFWIYYKRLEKGRFKIPETTENKIELTEVELMQLTNGLKISKEKVINTFKNRRIV